MHWSRSSRCRPPPPLRTASVLYRHSSHRTCRFPASGSPGLDGSFLTHSDIGRLYHGLTFRFHVIPPLSRPLTFLPGSNLRRVLPPRLALHGGLMFLLCTDNLPMLLHRQRSRTQIYTIKRAALAARTLNSYHYSKNVPRGTF